jgi:hypothetical protein
MNSLKSTGPRTAAGKARSSRNALTHGLFSRDLIIAGEDPAEFNLLRRSMLQRLNPRDRVELQVIEQYINCSWKLLRAQSAEQEAYQETATLYQIEAISDLRREVANEADLLDDPRERALLDEELICDLEPADLPPPAPGLTLSRLLEVDTLERIGRYEQRICNKMQRCLMQLQLLRNQLIEETPSELTCELLRVAEADARAAEAKAEADAEADAAEADAAAANAAGAALTEGEQRAVGAEMQNEPNPALSPLNLLDGNDFYRTLNLERKWMGKTWEPEADAEAAGEGAEPPKPPKSSGDVPAAA